MVEAVDLIAINQSTEEKGLKLATVTELFETGTVKIQFYGEESPSEKEYSYLASYTPTVDDTVLMIPMAETYIVLGKILYGMVIPDIGYVTLDQLEEMLGDYALSSELEDYITTEVLTSTLGPYAKTSDISSTYVSNSALTTRLAGYSLTSHFHAEIHNSSQTQYGVDVAKFLNGTPCFSPTNNGVMANGSPSNKWDVVYASTGTINTSDRNMKDKIRKLTRAEKRAAKKIKKLLRTFRFKDAVRVKGEDARIHMGLIAQDVIAAFESVGLDPYQYALVCKNTWYEKNGSQFKKDGEQYTKEDEGVVEITQLGLRYEELLCFVMAAI
jgi:hypothetical protein